MAGFVTVRGPLFDGRAAHAAHDFCNDFETRYGREVENMVKARIHQVFRHPTGNYERHLQTVRSGAGVEVNDSNIIYGPWLEGTGSRNRTTRFKGYATFRLVAQRAERQAGVFADRMIDPYLRRMQ